MFEYIKQAASSFPESCALTVVVVFVASSLGKLTVRDHSRVIRGSFGQNTSYLFFPLWLAVLVWSVLVRYLWSNCIKNGHISRKKAKYGFLDKMSSSLRSVSWDVTELLRIVPEYRYT